MKTKIISRDAHCISRQNISDNALKILKRLQKTGHESYLVGGAIRELLLGMHPKDFDIATSATPEEVRKIFRNSRIIGKRFKIVHIFYENETIEVTTFRGHHDHKTSDEGMILRDNVYGTLEEDAMRRDFTINALYYTIENFSIIDYLGGVEDIKNKIIRTIGDPEIRFREDPVRILRALRFAAKLDFKIHSVTENSIRDNKDLLSNVSRDRLLHEVQKLFLTGHAKSMFNILEKYKILEILFPLTENALKTKHAREFLDNTFDNTDDRYQQNLPLAPAFLFSSLLWIPFENKYKEKLLLSYEASSDLYFTTMQEVIFAQNQFVAIPQFMSNFIYDVWFLQLRMLRIGTKSCFKIHEHKRFRAAYDLLLLRAKTDDSIK